MKHYIGVDFHLQHSSIAVMDQNGSLIDEQKLYHSEEDRLHKYFESLPKDSSVSLEATRNWYWIVDYLQDLGLSVNLVHAKKARIIAESTIKTDKIDARVLAHLDRSNFLPKAYIATKDIRHQRELLRYYISMVKIRSSIKNRVHAILAKNNVQHNFTDLFGTAGMQFLKDLVLPAVFKSEIDGYCELLMNIRQRVKDAQSLIKEQCSTSPYVKRLITIPGISYYTALLLAAEIADINRFANSKKLCSYAGLVSSTRQSADKTHYGHIIKDSNKYIRYALIEAVLHTVRKDPDLYRFYMHIRRAKGIAKARVATARKLLIYIYAMLKNDTDYRHNRSYYNQAISVTKLGI